MSDRRPLAERLRPDSLDAVVGQAHLTGPDGALTRMLSSGQLRSLIFWGPPGTGKTTLARLCSQAAGVPFIQMSAVTAGLKDLRQAFSNSTPQAPVVIFLDEIHRFNKAQQDALLPVVETGQVVLIGATTENPSFEVNRALLSRAQVYAVKALDRETLVALIESAAQRAYPGLTLAEGLAEVLAHMADGDARRALHALEAVAGPAAEAGRTTVTRADADQALGEAVRAFDHGGDVFYEQISAMHKAVRGSSPDGAIYWFARMIDGGCDPLYIGRRLVRMASEDLGNADPRALSLALDACAAYERLGSPEGELALAQAVLYLASVPKSNAAYTAYKSAMAAVKRHGSLDVPMHLRNAPTQWMREQGFGAGYRYDPDEADGHAAGQAYLPDALADARFYTPRDAGLESRIAQRLARLNNGSRA